MACPDDGPGPDLVITRGPPAPVDAPAPAGEVVADLTVAGSPYYTAVRNGPHHLFRAHRLGDFLIDLDAHTIECRLQAGTDPSLISVLLGGTVSAFYLGLTGAGVLHGSAVEVDGQGIAFVGHSGAGKSTMAALMCASGARLLCDDVLHLGMEEGPGARCLGRASELRLRTTSLSVLDGMPTAPQVRATADGKVAVAFSTAADGAVDLSRIVIPLPSRTEPEIRIRPLGGAEAVMALSRYPRILGWRARDVLEAQFNFLARLAPRVPVYEAVLPWGPPFLATRARELLDHLRVPT